MSNPTDRGLLAYRTSEVFVRKLVIRQSNKPSEPDERLVTLLAAGLERLLSAEREAAGVDLCPDESVTTTGPIKGDEE